MRQMKLLLLRQSCMAKMSVDNDDHDDDVDNDDDENEDVDDVNDDDDVNNEDAVIMIHI